MNPATQQTREQPPRDHVVPMGAARATTFNPLAAFDAMAAPLTRAIEANERELGILAERDAAEARVLGEAEPIIEHTIESCIEVREPAAGEPPRIEIFDDRFTIGLLAEFEADLKLDGFNPTGIGIRRNAAGGIAGLVIVLAPHRERGA